MSYPSDFRYLPFTDASNYVQKVEYHQIPATSPFEVRLNEVPEKASPSTMTIKIVTGFTDGAPVYGATMTEVSATPASGEFYPDYYTEAAGDNSWNTGTIQFNSANANTLIEVTYMATGGLASIKSNHYPSWMTDRGDGSDGIFAPTADTTITAGVHNYTAVFIPSGVTVTVARPGATIKCQGAFVVNGTLFGGGVDGADASYSPRTQRNGYGGGNGGAEGYGTAGGTSNVTIENQTMAGSAAFQYMEKTVQWCGADGANGGPGGQYKPGGEGGAGASGVYIVAKEFINNGTVNFNGGKGGNGTGSNAPGAGAGGGGGGVVIVFAHKIKQGTITVAAGAKGISGDPGYRDGAAGTAGFSYIKELGE